MRRVAFGARSHHAASTLVNISRGEHVGMQPWLAAVAASATGLALLAPQQTRCEEGYKQPADDFVSLVDAPPTPSISVDPSERFLLLMTNPPLRTLSELCIPQRRLAGLRFDPVRQLPALASGYTALKLRLLFDSEGQPVPLDAALEVTIDGIPDGAKVRSTTWRPDGGALAFVVLPADVTVDPELWLATFNFDLDYPLPRSVHAKRLLDRSGNPLKLNSIRGAPVQWHPDGKHLLLRCAPWPALPQPSCMTGLRVPMAPPVQDSEPGVKAPARTYADMLKSPDDEDEYEWQLTTQLVLYNVAECQGICLCEPAMYRSASISPDGKYILVSQVQRPFSFLVGDNRFGRKVQVWELDGPGRWDVATLPIIDKVPTLHDACEDFPRQFAWRPDCPHTLRFWKALDGGDPRNQAAARDQIFSIAGAPFAAEQAIPGPKFGMRLDEMHHAADGTTIISEYRWKDRREVTWCFSKGALESESEPGEGRQQKLFDRNFQDKYDSPGSFQKQLDPETKKAILRRRAADGAFFLFGAGASPRGSRPFVDALNLQQNGAVEPMIISERLWRCVAGPSTPGDAPEDPAKEVGGVLAAETKRKAFYERPAALLGDTLGRPLFLLFWREAQDLPPNMFLRRLARDSEDVQITNFEHPQPSICGVQKQLVNYKREDGVELNATLFLPAGHDPKRDAPLPCLMWAYPREFKTKATAGQVSSSPYSFVRVPWSKPAFWTLRGYAIFDDCGMPIIGEGDLEPNDCFVNQLTMNARAAVDAVVNQLKVADPDRICVGGHSYGAFMTAHLLAHTEGLFRAGLCRSGAYNRSLTPFGFQYEERSYWDAPETYHTMSPFLYAKLLAEKQAPLLFIHGEDDPNSGTQPQQSERLFAAIKGNGGTARLVVLPKEEHGYAARESILHVLYESDRWLDKFNAPRTPEERDAALEEARSAAKQFKSAMTSTSAKL